MRPLGAILSPIGDQFSQVMPHALPPSFTSSCDTVSQTLPMPLIPFALPAVLCS